MLIRHPLNISYQRTILKYLINIRSQHAFPFNPSMHAYLSVIAGSADSSQEQFGDAPSVVSAQSR